MKRAGVVLLALGLAVQFAAGAGLFASHEQWTRTCAEHSKHLCNDVSSHETDHCAICVVTATGPALLRLDPPQAADLVETTFAAPIAIAPALERDCDTSCPRGPPAARA